MVIKGIQEKETSVLGQLCKHGQINGETEASYETVKHNCEIYTLFTS